jgi:hypothetical protein
MILPFALMLVSAPLYLTARKQGLREKLFYWKNCFAVFECLALLIFYLACNYVIIREASMAPLAEQAPTEHFNSTNNLFPFQLPASILNKTAINS